MKLLIPITLILFCLINCNKEVRVTSDSEKLDTKGTWSEYQQDKIEFGKAKAQLAKWGRYHGEMKWVNAQAKCASLGIRLPTRAELENAYKEKETESWKTDLEKSGYSSYWSSEEYSYNEAFAYAFNVENGKVGFNLKITNYHTRCIGDEELFAKQIDKLELGKWSQHLGKMEWEKAKAKCASIGMRLPTIAELKAAYKANVTVSWKADGIVYWSSDEYSNGSAYAFFVSDGDGSNYFGRDADLRVRCIR